MKIAGEYMKTSWEYKISVIMPIYNTSDYLVEAIESVINQSIGFEHIQLILVNNGADKKAHDICIGYLNEYPDNIEYVKLDKNIGVSAARNIGISYVRGKYTNFMDSDDRWTYEGYERLISFFEEHFDEVDFVSGRIKYFEGRNDWHGLDWKFKYEKEIVDLNITPERVQLNVGASLIKSKILSHHQFDNSVKHAEDARLLTEIAIIKLKYGLIKNAEFDYRVRNKGDSVLQNVKYSRDWYFGTVECVYKHLMLLSQKRYGIVIPYVQWLVMYELQWRLPTPLPDDFCHEEKTNYIDELTWLIKRIDDEVILKQRCLWIEYKIYALSKKYNISPRIDNEKTIIAIGSSEVDALSDCVYVEGIELKGEDVRLKGFVRTYKGLLPDTIVIETDTDCIIKVQKSELEIENQVKIFNQIITEGFRFEFTVKRNKEVRWKLGFDSKEIYQNPYVFKSAAVNVGFQIHGVSLRFERN